MILLAISNQKHFKLIAIKLTNLSDIEKYVDNKLAFSIVDDLAKRLKRRSGEKMFIHMKR